LSDAVGLEILGVDAGRPIDGETRRALNEAFVQAGVLLFRGAGTSVEAHLNVSRCFGALERHSVKESWTEGCPELIDISYRPTAPGEQSKTQPIYEVSGEALAGWLPWHTDQCFMPLLSRGGVLRALQVPPTRGRTGFIDKIRLYETLPEDLKAAIEGLSVIYQFEPRMDRHKFGKPAGLKLLSSSAAMDSILDRLDRDFPPAIHPLVYAQRETGRKVLNFSPAYALRIRGMDAAKSDDLLSALTEHCLAPGHAYFHDWRAGDLVVWDNWRTLHSAEGSPAEHARIMHRTSIAGDYGLGSGLTSL
jgi:taurine dioxygenase